MSQVSVIKETIEALLSSPNFDAQAKMALFAKVFEPFPYFDGTLALILCLASKVKHISLTTASNHPLPMTRHVLNVDWAVSHGGKSTVPLQELETLTLRIETSAAYNFDAAS
jgi:hypothetical protein